MSWPKGASVSWPEPVLCVHCGDQLVRERDMVGSANYVNSPYQWHSGCWDEVGAVGPVIQCVDCGGKFVQLDDGEGPLLMCFQCDRVAP